jgi:hypothetical protein
MEVGRIVDNLEKAAGLIRGDKGQPRFEMASQLDCLARFLQVIQHSYGAIYIALLRLSLISPEDITQERLELIESRIDQLDATGVGYDVDVIGNRLRSMHEGRAKTLRPIMDKYPAACDWHALLGAMDERDTPLIADIYTATTLMRRCLQQLRRDPGQLKSVHATIVNQAVEVRTALEKAQWLYSQILGLSTLRLTPAPNNQSASRIPNVSVR